MFSLYLKTQRPKIYWLKRKAPKKEKKGVKQETERGEAEGPPRCEACQGWSPAGLSAACRDSPLELRSGLAGTQVAGPSGEARKGRQPRAGGMSGPSAFLGIRLLGLPLLPLLPSFRPRLEQDGQSTPSSSAGVSPAAGRGPRPCPLGWHRLFPVSQDHFAISAPLSAPFSTDGTRLTPGRASFMTIGPADCSLRLWCVPNFSQTPGEPLSALFVD